MCDVSSELYIMEHFYDYIMVNGLSIVEQAHETHVLVKGLEKFGCAWPEMFVVVALLQSFHRLGQISLPI